MPREINLTCNTSDVAVAEHQAGVREAANTVDSGLFRNIMAATPAPVTVVSTLTRAGPAGATVSAFMSLSLDPMLVAVALRRSSGLLALVAQERAFGVNLLAAIQSDVAARFAGPVEERFAGVPWTTDHGQPRLEGTAAWLVCQLDTPVEAGDHIMLIGRVVHGSWTTEPPLVYSHRMFGTNSSMQTRVLTTTEMRIAALSRIAIDIPPAFEPKPGAAAMSATTTSATTTQTRAERPAAEDLVARVHAIGEIIRKNGPQGERDRRIPEETIQALTENGLFRLGTPRRFGGHGAPVTTMLDVSSAVAEYDGATAWVVTLINVSTWGAALFGAQAQDEIFGANPDAKVSGVGDSPTTEAREADGGIRISGKWYYNSGGLHSDWVVLGVRRTDDKGTPVGHSLVVVPRHEVTIEDTWHVAGMRATGSNCVVAEDVFVPAHRIGNTFAFIEGQYDTPYATEEPAYRAAWQPVLSLVLVGPQLGLGREALRLVTSQAARRPISLTFYEKEKDSVGFQLQIARAKMMLDTARLHAYRAAADIDSAAAGGTYPDPLARGQIRADCGWAVEHVRDAINLLIDAHGAGSYAESHPLQRIWRDSSVGGHHAMMNYTINYEVYGKLLLGVETPAVPVI